ncbi:MAG TPA: hypothetical protein VE967_01870, partial [Gemmatimonadaceae bacterium]|nr:hypothetical protein [Gemmatimonadaceae bacterium]
MRSLTWPTPADSNLSGGGVAAMLAAPASPGMSWASFRQLPDIRRSRSIQRRMPDSAVQPSRVAKGEIS